MKLFSITLDKDYHKTKLKELMLLYQKKAKQTNKKTKKKTKQNKTKKLKKKKTIAKLKLMPLLWSRNCFQTQIGLQRSFKSVA